MSKYNLLLLLLLGFLCWQPNPANSLPLGSPDLLKIQSIELNQLSTQHNFQIASVCFLGVGDCDQNINYGKGDDYSVDTEKQCQNEGFIKPNCSSSQIIDDVCPYNPGYGKGCKCRNDLITCPAGQTGVGDACNGQYASCQCSPSLVSCASNQTGSGAYCGGKYESCICKPEYQYNSSNCTSPRSLSGATCGNKYIGCSCPTGVSAGSFGCAEYYPSPCSSICKRAKTDNCDMRSSANAPYGCMTYWSDCSSKCQTAYPDNCRSRDAISLPGNAECSGYYGDCGSKCSTWRCQANYINWCTAPETNCTTLGYTKTASQCTSSYVKCPYGSAVYCAE